MFYCINLSRAAVLDGLDFNGHVEELDFIHAVLVMELFFILQRMCLFVGVVFQVCYVAQNMSFSIFRELL